MKEFYKQLKIDKSVKTTEELFNLPPQPSNQCPIIDKELDSLKNKLKDIDWDLIDLMKENSDIDKEVQSIRNQVDELWCVNEAFEEIRGNCESIREWGEAWKDVCKYMFYKHPELIDEYLGND